MTIVTCDASFDERWNTFALTHPRASFYHRAEWRGVNERSFGHKSCYLAALDGDRLVGIFPFVQVKSLLFGNIACSLPFVNFGGPCGESDSIEQALLDAAVAVAEQWSVDYLEIRSVRNLGAQFPVSTHKVSMTVDLHPDHETLWTAFKHGQRQDIRRGYKNGFVARFGGIDLVDDLYAILSESWRDQGTPMYARSYLVEILNTFPEHTALCIVYNADGVPAAGAFEGHHQGTVEGMWLGIRSAYRRQLAGYVLYWELIKHACDQGHRRFHLGRSSVDSGAEQFKKKWNAAPAQLYWHYLLRTRSEVPQLNVQNNKFQLAIAAWRRLPIAVTQLVGPMIARSIP
jgi:FemAB-related protein (PEP-CTERM system-associated)